MLKYKNVQKGTIFDNINIKKGTISDAKSGKKGTLLCEMIDSLYKKE